MEQRFYADLICAGCHETSRRQYRVGGGWRTHCSHCGLPQDGPAMLRAKLAELHSGLGSGRVVQRLRERRGRP